MFTVYHFTPELASPEEQPVLAEVPGAQAWVGSAPLAYRQPAVSSCAVAWWL